MEIPLSSRQATVEPSTQPPAASVGPSVPSEPTLTSATLGSPARIGAAASANSWLRPPLPRPVSFTTVSPPTIKARRAPSVACARTISASRRPATRASSATVVSRISGAKPRAAQADAAAAHSSRTLPATIVSTFATARGVSCARQARTDGEKESPYLETTACAWAQVEVSAAAGPEAIMSSGSPRTSERTIWKMRAGAQAAAKRPPLTRESRLRIVLISTMSAPQARSWRVTSASSPPETSGASKRAEPPPERRKTTVSCGDRPCTKSSTASVARNEFSSGTGCPASWQAMRGRGCSTWPYFVTTMPRARRSPSTALAAAAMRHAALPAATSRTSPAGSNVAAERARRTAASGFTASIAAVAISMAVLFNGDMPQVYQNPRRFSSRVRARLRHDNSGPEKRAIVDLWPPK